MAPIRRSLSNRAPSSWTRLPRHSLTLEAPGLLAQGGDANTSLSVDGGYVEVPFSSSLLLKSFTVEAFVRPSGTPKKLVFSAP